MKPSTSPAFLSETNTGCRVAVFGKHPIAADHLEDFGLNGTSLIAFKQMFYVDAVGQNIAQGRWKGSPEDGLPWNHWLLAVGPGGYLLARCLASQDSRGRKQYPLVLAAHCPVPAVRGIGKTMEILKTGETLMEADSREKIETWRQQAQTTLEAEVPQAPEASAEEKAEFSEGEHQQLCLLRVLHACLQGGTRPRLLLPTISPQGGDFPLWTSFLRNLLPTKARYLTFTQSANRCLTAEAHLAKPEPEPLRSLFSSSDSAKRTLTTDMPFPLEEEFLQQQTPRIQSWAQGSSPALETEDPGKTGLWAGISKLFRP